ncbi:MAG: tellurite resistance TerB family protein [Planctomycetota bacterium]|jgi:uncharacterized membrane protein YebE (DUF533 family)|nr:tellurite resistance TerB family protein [Planctomycetota bacterium]
MDILQQLTNLVGQAAAPQQAQQGGGGGLGGLLDPSMLSGLIGSLMGGKGGAAASGARAAAPGGMDLGGLLGGLLGGGGASILGSLLGGLTPPPAPQASATGDLRIQKKNENILRALVYAAKADGSIDRQEEASINEQVQKMGLGREAQTIVNQALSERLDPGKIAANITDSNEAMQIFALSAALTRVDTKAEQQYIASLGAALGIPANAQQSIVKRIFG